MRKRDRPVLVYDGECGFCTSSARFVERHIPTGADIVPSQATDLDALGTTRQRAAREVLWVDRQGRVCGGARAAAGLLRDAGGRWALIGWLLGLPPFSWAVMVAYRIVAANRHRLPGGTHACGVGEAE
jgi:predicted DCC family thiol-disulfide oxidoreductase YuxK